MKQLYKQTDQLNVQRNQKDIRFNIFLTKEQYAKLNNIKYQYRLSFSYIIKIVSTYLGAIPNIIDLAKNTQLYKTTWKKSSVKLADAKTEGVKYAKFVNNILIIYLENMYKDLVDNKTYNKLTDEIKNQMNITQDEWYDYNISVRHYVAIKNKGL